MTMLEQQHEGEFRFINSRVITNSEEIAFYQGISSGFFLESVRTGKNPDFLKGRVSKIRIFELYKPSMSPKIRIIDFLMEKPDFS